MRHKKIPGKKCKGFKDADAQHARRNQELELKINSTPHNPEEQEMPKKLRLLVQSMNEVKQQQQQKHKKTNASKNETLDKTAKMSIQIIGSNTKSSDDSDCLIDSTKHMGYEMKLPGMTKPLKPIPVFKQMPGEKKKAFFRRMDLSVQAVLKRKHYEDKFDVDVIDNPETGETKIQDRIKDEVDIALENSKNAKRAKKGAPVIKTKEEKRQLRRAKDKERKLKKKRKKKQNSDNFVDFDDAKFSDKVSFNELVHAPPQKLTKIENYAERRPGSKTKKNNLLLAKKFEKGAKEFDQNSVIKNHKINKHSSMSLARKHMLEGERKRVIEQYRKLKNNSAGNT